MFHLTFYWDILLLCRCKRSDFKTNSNKYIIVRFTLLFLINLVVEITCGSQSYDEYVKNHPTVNLQKIQRSYNVVQVGDLKHHVFIYQLYKSNNTYRAFCAGSIVTDTRVLTSAHCFLTNRKRKRRKIQNVRIVAGILYTLAIEATSDDNNQQWRSIKNIHSQRFFRFPAFNIAVLEVKIPWIFNKFVNKIPYTQLDQDFDGVCISPAVKPTQSWSYNKTLVVEHLRIIKRVECEKTVLRSCMYYYCTKYHFHTALVSIITEGGGLLCHGTGDPAEKEDGVLVGVTSLLSTQLPTLYNRIGVFHKWVADACEDTSYRKHFLFLSLIMFVYHRFLHEIYF